MNSDFDTPNAIAGNKSDEELSEVDIKKNHSLQAKRYKLPLDIRMKQIL